jgi:hypothetical protein
MAMTGRWKKSCETPVAFKMGQADPGDQFAAPFYQSDRKRGG